MFSRAVLQELATVEPERRVVSIYARTDPRDPANTSGTPAWRIQLRNGLARVAQHLEAGGQRDERLAFRDLSERIESALARLAPAERGRSVAWFVDLGGDEHGRHRLQLPVRRDRVVLDERPYISPLVDIADRGAPTGVVLVTGGSVRLLEIQQGEPNEPDDSTFELELGDWRPFGGTAGGSPERGTRAVAHEERYEARLEAQRARLFDRAAHATARRLGELGWERVLLVSERGVAASFREALPDELRERVVAESDLNLARSDAHAVAEALEPEIEAAWLRRASGLADLATARARAGGAATLGADQTLAALAEGRVDHLLVDPAHEFRPAMIPEAVGGPPELLAERAVEAAIATSAEVTAVEADSSAALRDAGGIAALLRY